MLRSPLRIFMITSGDMHSTEWLKPRKGLFRSVLNLIVDIQMVLISMSLQALRQGVYDVLPSNALEGLTVSIKHLFFGINFKIFCIKGRRLPTFVEWRLRYKYTVIDKLCHFQ